MQSVRSKNTAPEMLVRRLIFRLGYRYRVHVKSLPGTPDIVLAARRKVVFVHGCYWHGHGCKKGQLPKSGAEFWSKKIARNQQRDAEQFQALEALGWETITIWQCELGQRNDVEERLKKFLGPTNFDRLISH
jgi:DNA mismatch endonuclease (patch repair protein)